jgi:hypothetical protein
MSGDKCFRVVQFFSSLMRNYCDVPHIQQGMETCQRGTPRIQDGKVSWLCDDWLAIANQMALIKIVSSGRTGTSSRRLTKKGMWRMRATLQLYPIMHFYRNSSLPSDCPLPTRTRYAVLSVVDYLIRLNRFGAAVVGRRSATHGQSNIYGDGGA